MEAETNTGAGHSRPAALSVRMLAPGARIAVVSPAGVYDPARLAAGVDLVTGWGFCPVRSPNLGATCRYLAGTVSERASDLAWALTAPDIDAVWFARGGYGTAQLLGTLPLDRLDARPVIGFSDATALFTALRGRGRPVHGPVLHSLADLCDDDTRATLRHLLATGHPPALPGRLLCGPSQVLTAPLTGGNLCVLASLCGTPWAWSARDAIAVLEDVAEPPYRLDRMINQLLQSGAFDGVRGIALGTFLSCNPPVAAAWTTEEVLSDLLAPLGVPVVAGLPVGHGARNRPWRPGTTATLSAGGIDVVLG